MSIDGQYDIFDEKVISYQRPYIKSVLPKRANPKGDTMVLIGENLGSIEFRHQIQIYFNRDPCCIQSFYLNHRWKIGISLL